MSEKLAPRNQEHLKDFEQLADSPDHLLTDGKHAERLHTKEKDQSAALVEAEQATHEATQSETQLNPIEQLEEAQKAAEETDLPPVTSSSQLGKDTWNREINHIRINLTPSERALSKLIHKPAVRIVSEAAGRTISRPSGLLGAGILAFIGSSSYLYLAKNQGFKYNYAVFLALFAGGFLFGVALELMVWTATRSRRHASD